MFLNRSSPPNVVVASLTPNEERAGSDGGGGPFLAGGVATCLCGCAPFALDVWFSFPSGIGALMNELFLLPNQLPLFFRDRLGLLSIVAGDPGRSDLRLSDDDIGRKPRYLRTEEGRLLPVGLVGDSVLPLSSLRLVLCSSASGPTSDESLDGGRRSVLGEQAVGRSRVRGERPFAGRWGARRLRRRLGRRRNRSSLGEREVDRGDGERLVFADSHVARREACNGWRWVVLCGAGDGQSSVR